VEAEKQDGFEGKKNGGSRHGAHGYRLPLVRLNWEF